MKLLGLTCGTEMGNTEVLVREALMAAEAAGVEVALVRLLDLDLKPCTGCKSCVESLMKGGAGNCIIKDDFPFLDDLIMESDGVILGAPVFVLGAHGLVKLLADRMGPSHDLAWRLEARKIREESGRTQGKGPDGRSFKRRIGGFVSVGGASTQNWLSLGLPTMHLLSFPSHITVVDQMQVRGTTAIGNVVLTPEALERAQGLGRNVAEAMLKPDEEPRWRGAEGICPVCHCDLLSITGGRLVECAVCGIAGTLTTDGGRITVTFNEEEQRRSRLALGGKKEHWDEVRAALGTFFQRPDLPQIPQRLEKYARHPIPLLTADGEVART
ncbi:MAG: flavodoxin family protein [Thermoleophilia bacterium]|nr:flavodoxin family protein [Thermoleophilia bacterium]